MSAQFSGSAVQSCNGSALCCGSLRVRSGCWQCWIAFWKPYIQVRSGVWKNSVSRGLRTEVPIDFLPQRGVLLTPRTDYLDLEREQWGLFSECTPSHQEKPRLRGLRRSNLVRTSLLSQHPPAEGSGYVYRSPPSSTE